MNELMRPIRFTSDPDHPAALLPVPVFLRREIKRKRKPVLSPFSFLGNMNHFLWYLSD